MVFLLIMVATGWCGPELKRESVDGILKRVHFPERERERSKRTEHSRTPGEVQRADSRERFQGGVLVFILGLLGTSQWLS